MFADAPTLQERAFSAAASVCDPEVPVLTIADLGVLHQVDVDAAGHVEVTILPTYSGCPAMGVIAMGIETALLEAGFRSSKVKLSHFPAWTTDMMSDEARVKLRDYGIAPPPRGSGKAALFAQPDVACPRCGSLNTERISEFGSTACKSQWRCIACREPFDHFKCI